MFDICFKFLCQNSEQLKKDLSEILVTQFFTCYHKKSFNAIVIGGEEWLFALYVGKEELLAIMSVMLIIKQRELSCPTYKGCAS